MCPPAVWPRCLLPCCPRSRTCGAGERQTSPPAHRWTCPAAGPGPHPAHKVRQGPQSGPVQPPGHAAGMQRLPCRPAAGRLLLPSCSNGPTECSARLIHPVGVLPESALLGLSVSHGCCVLPPVQQQPVQRKRAPLARRSAKGRATLERPCPRLAAGGLPPSFLTDRGIPLPIHRSDKPV